MLFDLLNAPTSNWRYCGPNPRLRVYWWCDEVKAIASSIEETSSIPTVREQMPLIQEIQSDAWWDDVTTPMLESARKPGSFSFRIGVA